MPGKVAEKGNPQNVHDDLRGGYLSWKPQTSVWPQRANINGLPGLSATPWQRISVSPKDCRLPASDPGRYGASSGQEDDIRRKAVFSCQGSFEGCRQRSEPIRRDAECGDIGNRTEHG